MVFVPVGLAYDRVLEDRVLVEAAAEPGRGGSGRVARAILALPSRFLWLAQAARADSGLWHGGGGVRCAAVAARD